MTEEQESLRKAIEKLNAELSDLAEVALSSKLNQNAIPRLQELSGIQEQLAGVKAKVKKCQAAVSTTHNALTLFLQVQARGD